MKAASPFVIYAATLFTPATVGVVLACAAGAHASFVLGPPVEPRSKMWSLFFACLVMGLAFTTITNAIIGHMFTGFQMTDGVHFSLGAVVSCLTRFWLPSLIENVSNGNWITWIPFLNKNRGNQP